MVKTIQHGIDRDADILEAIERRKAGERFYTVAETLANMRAAIDKGICDSESPTE